MELREEVARELLSQHDADPDVYLGMHGTYGHWLEQADAILSLPRIKEALELLALEKKFENDEFGL